MSSFYSVDWHPSPANQVESSAYTDYHGEDLSSPNGPVRDNDLCSPLTSAFSSVASLDARSSAHATITAPQPLPGFNLPPGFRPYGGLRSYFQGNGLNSTMDPTEVANHPGVGVDEAQYSTPLHGGCVPPFRPQSVLFHDEASMRGPCAAQPLHCGDANNATAGIQEYQLLARSTPLPHGTFPSGQGPWNASNMIMPPPVAMLKRPTEPVSFSYTRLSDDSATTPLGFRLQSNESGPDRVLSNSMIAAEPANTNSNAGVWDPTVIWVPDQNQHTLNLERRMAEDSYRRATFSPKDNFNRRNHNDPHFATTEWGEPLTVFVYVHGPGNLHTLHDYLKDGSFFFTAEDHREVVLMPSHGAPNITVLLRFDSFASSQRAIHEIRTRANMKPVQDAEALRFGDYNMPVIVRCITAQQFCSLKAQALYAEGRDLENRDKPAPIGQGEIKEAMDPDLRVFTHDRDLRYTTRPEEYGYTYAHGFDGQLIMHAVCFKMAEMAKYGMPIPQTQVDENKREARNVVANFVGTFSGIRAIQVFLNEARPHLIMMFMELDKPDQVDEIVEHLRPTALPYGWTENGQILWATHMGEDIIMPSTLPGSWFTHALNHDDRNSFRNRWSNGLWGSEPWTAAQRDMFNGGRVRSRLMYGPGERVNHVDPARIQSGKDCRTTLMVRNVPNQMTSDQLKYFLNTFAFHSFDFMYLRVDFSTGNNVGYAFVNFVSPMDMIPFVERAVGRRWPQPFHRFTKSVQCSYATIQGRDTLIEKFRNSSVMVEVSAHKPKLFFTRGHEQAGDEEPFPEPNNPSKLQRSLDNGRMKGLYAPAHHQTRRPGGQYDRGHPANANSINTDAPSRHGAWKFD